MTTATAARGTRRRRRRVAALVLLALLITIVGVMLVQARQAVLHMERARALLPDFSGAVSAEAAELRRSVEAAAAEVHAARGATSGPHWALAAALPGVGRPVDVARNLVVSADEVLGGPVLEMLGLQDDLSTRVLAHADALDLSSLQQAREVVVPADLVLTRERRRLAGLPTVEWLGPLVKAQRTYTKQLDELSGVVARASLLSQLGPPLLGADEPRSYFLAIQQPAQTRGTGGLLAAYGLLRASNGKLTLEKVAANSDLPPLPAEVQGLDPAFVARYAGENSTRGWLNANITPHFPYAASAWLEMWRATKGEQLDGVLAVDPHVIAGLLDASEPVAVPGVGRLDGKAVVRFLGAGQYEVQADSARREELLVRIAEAAIQGPLSREVDEPALLKALGRSADGGNLMLASRHRDEQDLIERLWPRMAVPDTDRPYLQTVLNNAPGTKLDHYVRVRTEYAQETCTAGTRQSRVRVRIHNTAPRSGLPAYVVHGGRRVAPGWVPGENTWRVDLLLSRGARVTRAILDGRPIPVSTLGELPDTLTVATGPSFTLGSERGHPALTTRLTLRPGAAAELELELVEPASDEEPLVVGPALMTPPQSVLAGRCVEGAVLAASTE